MAKVLILFLFTLIMLPLFSLPGWIRSAGTSDTSVGGGKPIAPESIHGTETLVFTFDSGLEGWSVGDGGGEFDSARWISDIGNPPGSVELDGSDVGEPNGVPNSWMYRTITVPENGLLYFYTRAAVNGALRVRVVDSGGASHTLLDWEVLSGESWRERTVSLGAYGGETVTLYFEQGDNAQGVGEHRFIDNIIICPARDGDDPGRQQGEPECAQGELVADAIEVTQAIQDLNNSVRLVAYKRPFVRFHVHAEEGGAALSGAHLTVQQGPNEVTLSPVNANGQILVQPGPERAMLDHAFLFELPSDFTQGEISLTAEVNHDAGVVEDEYDDNIIGPVTVTFEEVPPVPLVFTRIGYTLGGTTYYPSIVPHRTNMFSWLRTAYPIHELQVRLRVHHLGAATADANGDLTSPDCATVNSYLDTLRLVNVGSGWADADAHYYGMVSDEGAFMRGCSALPGNVASGPAGAPTTTRFSWDTDGSYGDWYGAHELGHSFDRKHAMFCGAADGDPFPHPNGRISPALAGATALFGFDLDTSRIYSAAWHDVMSYCDNQWISDFTYEGLMDYFQNNLSRGREARHREGQGNYLLLSGRIDPQDNEFAVTRFVVLPGITTEPPPLGEYAIVLSDSDGVELGRYPVAPTLYQSGPAPGATNEISTLALNALVPWVDGTQRVAVEGPGGSLVEISASGSPPAVTLLSPGGGELITGESLTVQWSASDADGDPLSAHVQYSPDSGATWEMLAMDERGDSVVLPTESLIGSDQALFRVLVSDGFHTTYDVSDATVVVPNHPPQVEIATPLSEEERMVSARQTLALAGDAYDPDSGTMEAGQLEWRSDLDGPLGNGRQLSVTGLSVGTHTIVFEADDGAGSIVSDTTTVTVLPTLYDLPPLPDELLAGPSYIVLDPRDGLLSATISVGNRNPARSIPWNVTATAPWLYLSTSGGETPFDSVVVSVGPEDPAGSGQEAVVIFTSPALPGASVTVRVEVLPSHHHILLPLVVQPQVPAAPTQDRGCSGTATPPRRAGIESDDGKHQRGDCTGLWSRRLTTPRFLR